MPDVLVAGRRFRPLHSLDLLTRACVALEGDPSLPGQRVTWVLDQLVATSGAPKQLPVENGAECAGHVLDAWAYAHGGPRDCIEPGQPTQYAHAVCP
jgi:hypothetical protein